MDFGGIVNFWSAKSITSSIRVANKEKPTLGIGDPRHDNRIDFIAGFHGLEGIEKKVNNGEAKVGFALFATQMENVISFADKKLNMPPKSTWFDPKPLDGLVAYEFE